MHTIDEIRHGNLLLLIDHAGSIQAVADKLGKSHAQISQLKNRYKHSGSDKRRGVGDDLAREIEIAFQLPRGWMDNLQDRFPHEGTGTSDEPPFAAKMALADIMSKLPADERRAAVDFMRYRLSRNRTTLADDDLSKYAAALDAFDPDLPKHRPN